MSRVLVVDDVPESVRLIELLLHAEGHEVITVESPARAFGLLKLRPVDLVIADQNMPGMTGEAFLDRVALLWPKAARLMLTADMHVKGDGTRAYPVMYKPFKIAELRAQVKSLLDRRKP